MFGNCFYRKHRRKNRPFVCFDHQHLRLFVQQRGIFNLGFSRRRNSPTTYTSSGPETHIASINTYSRHTTMSSHQRVTSELVGRHYYRYPFTAVNTYKYVVSTSTSRTDDA